ncbi:hypothetical protein KIPE111705_00180 [Kibdelosporangium persicum]|uniref:Uncharacterized protein n=1 Tax=Kibdelosporangium persicum TaxID=2698649 RepID=A0ABX2F8Z0_9PSEU|nr:hypothetical protein [Kibdelosporangium persicum]NRN67589.1 hypothetical protein [Kibdelosporangium persicum]
MAQRLNPAARDSAVGRVRMITTGVVALGLAGTMGLGFTIAEQVKADKAAKAQAQVTEDTTEVAQEEQLPQDQVPQAQVPQEQVPQEQVPQGQATPRQTPRKQATPGTTTPAPKPKPTPKPPVTSSGGS